jgi:hypothetical protein
LRIHKARGFITFAKPLLLINSLNNNLKSSPFMSVAEILFFDPLRQARVYNNAQLLSQVS